MLLSRNTALFKNIRYLNAKKQINTINLNQIRTCFIYRSAPKHETKWVIVSEILGGIMWWWIFWNFWYEYKHLIGHFPELCPADWTDEELGIPPDDA